MKQDQIKVFKLSTGEEVVCCFEGKEADGSYKISRPLRVMMGSNPASPTDFRIALVDFSIISDPGDKIITISKEFVVAMLEPKEEIRNSYIEKVSGITIPQPKLLNE